MARELTIPAGYALDAPVWECFHCEGGFHWQPGFCQDCGVELRRVPDREG